MGRHGETMARKKHVKENERFVTIPFMRDEGGGGRIRLLGNWGRAKESEDDGNACNALHAQSTERPGEIKENKIG